MPCYRCGARQVDPARGPSPWKRGVRGDHQVLVCPQCQSERDWASDLDRCPNCGSVRLVRRLGDVECRDCGHVGESADTPAEVQATTLAPPPVGAPAPAIRAAGEGTAGTTTEDSAAAGDSAAALAEEVARALDRVLGSHRVSG
jgi:uncharacterized Zn finger protein (UPF0148 family)